MLEVKGNLWDFHDTGKWIVIPTNGTVKRGYSAVMGRGIALQCKTRYPQFPVLFGRKLSLLGNHVSKFDAFKILTFPVKDSWFGTASIDLIKRSVQELQAYGYLSEIFLPKVGCGNGGLRWSEVRLLLEVLDNRFTVVSLWTP